MVNLTDFLQRAAASLRGQATAGEWTRGRLVAPGQILIPTPEAKKLKFTVGDGVRQDDLNFVADRHGFPRLQAAVADGKTPASPSDSPDATVEISLTLAILPLVEISADALEAWLNLMPPDEEGDLPTLPNLMELIRKCGLLHGLREDVLGQCYDKASQEKIATVQQLIAFGDPAVPGRDAMIRMEVEVGVIPGKVLDDGRIDFRERRAFVAVKKDQVLAVKIPATSGRRGINVRGEEISAFDGVDIAVKTADLCAFNPDDGTIRATGAGILSMVGGNTFRVSAKQDISGDVDFSTGNIRFQGNLEITGSVQPGFTVASRGDVRIGGSVQSAKVNAHGNLIIAGGVVGETSSIHAEGDIDVKFIERGKAVCGGSLRLQGSAYYSDIAAEKDIVGQPDSRIIGGNVRCGGSITIGTVGSAATTDTALAAGLHLRRWRRALELHARIDELRRAMNKLIQYRGEKNLECDAYAELQMELAAEERDMAGLNLANDGSKELTGGTGERCASAEIHVTGVLHAGVRIRLGNVEMVADHDYFASRFFQDSASGALIAASL